MAEYTKKEAIKILKDRINMLQGQIDNMKKGGGFTIPGVTRKQQIRTWELEISKTEKRLNITKERVR